MSNQTLNSICAEISEYADKVSQADLEKIADKIIESKRIFVAGAGRSGFMIRCFANRLMHLGYTVFLVGETTTPSIHEGDLLIVGSGSGETGSLVTMADKAKKQNASIVLLSLTDESSVGNLADFIMLVPGYSPKVHKTSTVKTIQPMGSLFEQLSLLIYESIVIIIKNKLNISEETMFARHANLE